MSCWKLDFAIFHISYIVLCLKTGFFRVFWKVELIAPKLDMSSGNVYQIHMKSFGFLPLRLNLNEASNPREKDFLKVANCMDMTGWLIQQPLPQLVKRKLVANCNSKWHFFLSRARVKLGVSCHAACCCDLVSQVVIDLCYQHCVLVPWQFGLKKKRKKKVFNAFIIHGGWVRSSVLYALTKQTDWADWLIPWW